MGFVTGIDIRNGKCKAAVWNAQTGFPEMILEVPLEKELGRAEYLSQEDAFRTLFARLRSELGRAGMETQEYIVCIPDSFRMEDRMRLMKTAGRTGVRIKRMIPDSEAAAIYAAWRYQVDSPYLVVRISEGNAVLSAYDYGSGVLESKQKTIRSLEPGLATSLSMCMDDLSASAFMREDDRGTRFCAPGLVILLGNPDSTRAAEMFFRSSLKGLAGNEYTQYLSDVGGDIFVEGTAVYGGVLAGTNSWLLFLDSMTPHSLYVQYGEQLERLNLDTIPAQRTLHGGKTGGNLNPVQLYEEQPGGILKPIAAYGVPEGGVRQGADLDMKIDASRGITFETDSRKWEEMELTAFAADDETGTESILNFIQIADSLEYGIQGISDPSDPHLIGLRHILRQITELFEGFGITRYADPGDPFDPEIHNAVVHVTDIDLPANCIQKVIQSGYRTQDRIVRYANVVVAN